MATIIKRGGPYSSELLTKVKKSPKLRYDKDSESVFHVGGDRHGELAPPHRVPFILSESEENI